MKVGDLCAIWSGDGDPASPKDWVVGVVYEMLRASEKMPDPSQERWFYRARWCTGEIDSTWYSESDIDLANSVFRS